MANKKNWWGMLVIVLAFGMTVVGCFLPDEDEQTIKINVPKKVPPSVPEYVTAEALTSNTITVSWSHVEGQGVRYRVYYSSSPSGSYNHLGNAYYNYNGYYTCTSSGFSPNTTYYYKVSAYNDNGESAQSSYASATT